MPIANDLLSPEALGPAKGVIFDCDGVIVDSFGANLKFYNSILAMFGMAPMTPAQEEYVHSHSVDDALAHILPPERLAEADKWRKGVNYVDLLPELRLEEGLTRFLSLLKSRGIPMAVNTNRTTTMDMVLDYFHLRGFFRPVITAGVVANPKPHPESVFRILDAWGLDAREVAYIGDSRVDEETARRAGVRFWAFKNEELIAGLHVRDFHSLRRLFLKRFNGSGSGCGARAIS